MKKPLTKKQTDFLDRITKKCKSKWKLNGKTGLVDVDGHFDIRGKRFKSFSGIKFGKVTGSFDCSHNKLTSLQGAPKKVEGSFKCNSNKLTRLIGAPQEVGEDFYCDHNQLTSLEGAPQKVGGYFDCNRNKLTSLEGAPQEVGGSFYCYENPITANTLELILKVMQTKGLEYKLALSSVKSKIQVKEWELLSKDVKFVSEDEELGVRILGRIL